MLTGAIRGQIDDIWNDFWTGGVSNPLSVIEQITYLLFIKRLDEMEALEEAKAAGTGKKVERRIFPAGKDGIVKKDSNIAAEGGLPYKEMRWKNFTKRDPREMFEIVDEHVFPFLRSLGGEGSKFAQHMRDARNGIPTPALLAKVVDKLDRVKMDDRDTKGDVYEYMLGKIASAGQNGQFRTPRHIIALMVELIAPTPKDTILDPAVGTAGFLVAASEYVRHTHPELFRDPALRKHFQNEMFNGFDFDATMLRIAAMNMVLHGVDNANIAFRDSLSEENTGEADCYSVVLANPPFAGSLDYEQCAKDLQQVVKTKKTELLFLALFLRVLKTGGRPAVIVPDGVLFGSSKAHKTVRKMLVEDHKLDAVVKLPSGVFRPYAGVSTAILLFTKTGVGGTDQVWFYDVRTDGWSLDDKRQPLLDHNKLGPAPEEALTPDEAEKNNLPEVVARWTARDSAELKRPRTAQSFCVPKAEIAKDGAYDLSLNRYKEVEHEEVVRESPAVIIAELKKLEAEISDGLKQLEEMVA